MMDSCVRVDRVGVLLINTGSPDAPEPSAVRRYLAEFLMDPCVRPLPGPLWWIVLHLFVLPRRQEASAEKYRRIWREDGSPLVSIAGRLARSVQAEVARRRPEADFVVRPAMCYGQPSVARALSELRDAGCSSVVAVPLYPQSASSTTASALAHLRGALAALGWDPPLIEVEEYASRPAYLDAVAARIERDGFDAAHDMLLFSFHSIPCAHVEEGDTYVHQVEATCRQVAQRLGVPKARARLSYQSPFEDNRTWQGPFTSNALADLARVPRRTFMVCPGFSIDCLETLYDVEYELRGRFDAAAVPGAELRYVPCLNDGEEQARLIASVVEDCLDELRGA